PGELTHDLAPTRPRAEPELAEVAPHVGSAHEADLRIEVTAHDETLELHPVAIAGVIHLRAMARVLPRCGGPAGGAPRGCGDKVVEEGECAIDAIRVVPSAVAPVDRPPGVHRSDAASAQNGPRDPHHGKIRGLESYGWFAVSLHVEQPKTEPAEAARQASASLQRHRTALMQPDAPAVEEKRRVTDLLDHASR